ncbi:MAG: flippase-like domain-containing protein [Bacteroidales bacterium]|nr:flippase-like domain-containing protein [Bacteroidales bacterium]
MLAKRILTILQYLFFLLLGLGLLWLSFRKLNLQDVFHEMSNAHFGWLFLSLFVTIISHLFRAARWNLLIGTLNYKTRLSTTFFSLMTGYLVNTGVPRLGEFVRCGVLSKKEKIPFNALFGTVISERIFDLFVFAILFVLVIVFQLSLLNQFLHEFFGPFFHDVFDNIWTISLFFGSIILLFVIAFLYWKRKKEHLKEKAFFHKIHDFMVGLAEGIKTIKRMKKKGLFLFYTFAIWFFYILMIYVGFFMLKETSHLNFIAGITVLTLGSLGIIAPVPGGIGAYHFVVKAILTEIYHIGPDSAISFATLTHAGQTLLNIVVGAFGYTMLIVTKKMKPSNG